MAPSRGFVWHHSWLDKLFWVWKVKAQDSCLEEGLVDCHKISVGDTHVDSSSISHAVETNSLESKSEASSSEFQLELNDERSQKLDYSKPTRKHSVDRLEDYRPHGTIVMTEFIFDAEESHCSKMFLCGDWNDWEPIPMVAIRDATQWSTITPVPIGYHEFGFVTDKGVWKWSRKHPWNETKRCHWRRIRGPSKSQKWKDNLSPSWWTLFCCIPLFILLWIMIVLERFKALFVDDTVVLSECDHLVNECLQEQQSAETTDNDSWWIASQDCMFQCALKVCKMFPRTDILIIRELHWKRLFLVAITVYTLGRFLPEILWVLLQ